MDEDASLLELDYSRDHGPGPASRQDLQEPRARSAMTAVFCTYQSLSLVAQAAQAGGAPPTFDLVVCDEAHRTTGVEDTERNRQDDRQTSPFRLVA